MIQTFLAAHWRAFLMLAIFAATLAWGEYWHLRADSAIAQAARIVAEDNAAASKAKADKAIEEARRESQLDEARTQHEKDVTNLNAYYAGIIGKLRDNAAHRSILPEAAPGSQGNQRSACFDRAALGAGLDQALQRFREGTIGILRQGDDAIAAFAFCRAFVEKVER